MKSERGADTVEVIIGIVVFVVFGLAVFGMVTKAAGNKMADTSNCLQDSGNIITNTGNNATSSNKCKTTQNGTYKYN
jgi:hypothetical protein